MMLLRKVDDEGREFSELRDCLWRLCEIVEKEKQRKNVKLFPKSRENVPYFSVECDARGVADNKKEEETMTKETKKKSEMASLRIPRDVWLKFKSLCAEKDKTLGGYLTEIIMELYANERGKEMKDKQTQDKDDEIKLF